MRIEMCHLKEVLYSIGNMDSGSGNRSQSSSGRRVGIASQLVEVPPAIVDVEVEFYPMLRKG